MSLELIELLGSGGVALLITMAAWLRHRRKPPPPPPPPDEEEPPREEEDEPPAEEPPPQPQLPLPGGEATGGKVLHSQKRLDEPQIIELIATHVAFSVKTVFVGNREIGQRIVEYRAVPSEVPADDWDVRPIRSLTEYPNLLPSERTKPREIALLHLLSGQALVAEHFEDEPVTEPVYEPIYRKAKQTVYVLMDDSGSMWEDQEFPLRLDWRIRIAKGVVLALMERCLSEKATFQFRWFTDKISPLVHVRNEEDARAFRSELAEMGPNGGTEIAKALDRAISDCQGHDFDQCDIMIVTDGEDKVLNADRIREVFNEHKMRLHAILLGVKNADLRAGAHVYQEIPNPHTVREPVVRS